MKTNSRTTLNLLAILALGFGSISIASADGFYFGGGAYKSEIDLDGFGDDDNTGALFLGYAFVDSAVILAAELGRYDLGNYSNDTNDFDGDATTLAGVVTLALGPFIEVYAKAGLAAIDGNTNGGVFDDNESFTGVGIGLDFFDTIDIYLERLDFNNDANSRLIGLGMRFDFF